jgi:hypothetical protein
LICFHLHVRWGRHLRWTKSRNPLILSNVKIQHSIPNYVFSWYCFAREFHIHKEPGIFT